jgi:molecular chaperone DnaK
LLDANVINEIRTDCAVLRRLLEGSGDLDTLRAAYTKLEGAAFRIAESMYGGDDGGEAQDTPA